MCPTLPYFEALHVAELTAYAGNYGSGTPSREDGLFGPFLKRSNITDGTSKTVAFSEWIPAGDRHAKVDHLGEGIGAEKLTTRWNRIA